MSGTKIQNTTIQNISQTTGYFTPYDIRESVYVIHDASTLATDLTVLMPSSPVSAQRLTITSVLGITVLTFVTAAGSNTTIFNAPNTLPAGATVEFIYSLEKNKWYESSATAQSSSGFTDPSLNNNFVENIKAGISTSILSLGDSTEAGITTWTYQFLQMVAAKFTTFNYCYYTWNKTNQTYDPVVFLTPGAAQNSRYLAMSGGQTGLYLPSADISPVTSDLDLRAYVNCTNYSSGNVQSLIGKHQSGVEVCFRFEITADGHLQLMWSVDGSTQIIKVSTVTLPSVGITNGQDIWLRSTLQLNNGSGGNNVIFYYSTNGTSWTQLGSTVTTTGTTSIFFGSAVNWELGTILNSANTAIVGNYYYAEIRNGINGPILSPYSIESWCRYLVSGATWTGTPLMTMFLGGEPGINLTQLQDSTKIKTMIPYNAHSMVMMSCGHNDGSSHGSSYSALWDSWLAAIKGRIKTGDFYVITQNPEVGGTANFKPYEEQARRQGEIVSWGDKNSLKVIDVHSVYLNTSGWQSLIQSDGTHPTIPVGYALWAQTVFNSMFYKY